MSKSHDLSPSRRRSKERERMRKGSRSRSPASESSRKHSRKSAQMKENGRYDKKRYNYPLKTSTFDRNQRFDRDQRIDQDQRFDRDHKFDRDQRERDYDRRRRSTDNYDFSTDNKTQREWDNEKRRRWRDPDNNKTFEWGKPVKKEELVSKDQSDLPAAPKEKPNFGTTGKLAEDTNKYKGVVIKYNEPPEACKPKIRWRLYPFKNNECLPTLYVHRQSAFLIGKDRRVVDLPVDHPSCSKQHAVLQYRQVCVKLPDGSRTVRRVKPYIIDLESANGTFLNNKQIETRKYYELFEKDVLKFGFSTREYVLLHEHSAENEEAEPQSDPDRTGSEPEDDELDSGAPVVKTEPLSDRDDN